MRLQIISSLLCLSTLGMAVPVPSNLSTGRAINRPQPQLQQFQAIPNPSAEGPNDNQVGIGSEVIGIISEFLPSITEAFQSSDGTPIERSNKITLAFLPIARAIIEARARNSDTYDKDYALKQQEQAEKVVPGILNSMAGIVNAIPPSTTLAPIVLPEIPEIPVFDNQYVPNQTIKEIKIPKTDFIPEIVIPEIKIQ